MAFRFFKLRPKSEGVTRSWTNYGKIIDAGRTISYVLGSNLTKLNLTKILHNVQKWLLINALKSKLQYSNPFQNASMPNKRPSSNIGWVAGHFHFLPHFNSKTTELIFTIFLYDIEQLEMHGKARSTP